MRIKSIENGKEKSLIINAPEVRIVDVAEQFKSNDVEGALKELALGQGNIGGTALKDIEQLKEDKKEILNKVNELNTKKFNKDAVSIDNNIDILTLDTGHYCVEGAVSTKQNYPIDSGWEHITIFNSGWVNTATQQGYRDMLLIRRNGEIFLNSQGWKSNDWSGWKQLATTENSFPMINKMQWGGREGLNIDTDVVNGFQHGWQMIFIY
ncbi:hypothetical protein [Clostridium weizhouense]|uniref:Uncharacterized protein n=1 Tax=Clostridium weizhouense TaxID=2859781 RepID=A0ABS7AIH2_9CLOT|nr:hypothetical protein [Clostridium weizhouense]MBW6408470.1 hypothetical protein [Clostridium weizhouense]